ncbi:MAG: rhodanese-like domain-containing protein [Chloroflexota bacterium]|nr:rhodanese-like domain-containing protein [Chloroflexota bacterium]
MGNRAAVSAQALQNLGYTSVSYMDGGMEAWKDKGLPISL